MSDVNRDGGFTGWDGQAFEAMVVPDFAGRMEAIRRHVRPRLEAIAEALAPRLAQRVGETLYPYVAQHARRTVNPPDETWCAWRAGCAARAGANLVVALHWPREEEVLRLSGPEFLEKGVGCPEPARTRLPVRVARRANRDAGRGRVTGV